MFELNVVFSCFFVVPDDIALAAAASFTTVALLAILYTAGMYIWRVYSIRFVSHFFNSSSTLSQFRIYGPDDPLFLSNRRAVTYHDYYGPTALCAVLLTAVIVNFALRAKQGF